MGRLKILMERIAFNIGYVYAYVKIQCQLLTKRGGINEEKR